MNYKCVQKHSSQRFNEEYQPSNKKSRIENEEFLNFTNPPDHIFNQLKIPRRTNDKITSDANIPVANDHTVSPILPPFPQVANNFRKICCPFREAAVADNSEFAVTGKANAATTPKQLKYYRCEQCSIFLSSQTTLDAHLAGARHAKKLKELELSSGTVDNLRKDKVLKLTENNFLCKVCNISAGSLIQVKSHIDDEKNSSSIVKSCNNGNKPTNVEKTESNQSFFCQVCGLCMNSQVQYDQHVNSKKHAAKVSKLHAPES